VSNAAGDVLAGSWRFKLVSIAGFSPWVVAGGWFHRTVGEAGLYAACLLAFLAAALVLLPGLLVGDARLRRTARWFLPSFTTYAVVWCACWFGLGGRTGEWLGALAGGACFVALSAWLLGRPRSPLVATVVFLSVHTAGYFAGDQAYRLIAASTHPKLFGMLAWGVCYGIGFGAGIGWLIHAKNKQTS
jgi:hypothetical protein